MRRVSGVTGIINGGTGTITGGVITGGMIIGGTGTAIGGVGTITGKGIPIPCQVIPVMLVPVLEELLSLSSFTGYTCLY